MKLVIFLTFLSALIACNQEEKPIRKDGFSEVPKTREDSLYKEVMDGHDIGMAKIRDVKKAASKAQQQLDSLNALPKEKIDVNYRQALKDLQEDLNYADFGMFEWMKEFKVDSAKSNPELRVRYLEAERQKVLNVKEAILSSLKKADSLMKNY